MEFYLFAIGGNVCGRIFVILPQSFLPAASDAVQISFIFSAFLLTASLPQPVKFPARKVHPCAPENSVFDGPVTNILLVLCVLIGVLSHAHAKGRQGRNNFKFDTSLRRFPNDTLASVAVEGLKTVDITDITLMLLLSRLQHMLANYTKQPDS